MSLHDHINKNSQLHPMNDLVLFPQNQYFGLLLFSSILGYFFFLKLVHWCGQKHKTTNSYFYPICSDLTRILSAKQVSSKKQKLSFVFSYKGNTMWQQATIEITWQDHSFIACSYHLHIGAILSAHPLVVHSCIQLCAYPGLQQHYQIKSLHKELFQHSRDCFQI